MCRAAGPGRFQPDQRHGVCARPSGGLRRLAPDGQSRLGLGRCAALFQEIAAPRRRWRRGRSRASCHRRQASWSPIRKCGIRRRAISSRPACGSACPATPTTTRRNRKASASCNSPSAAGAAHSTAAAFLDDAARAAESQHRHRRAGAPHRVRGQARHRRRILPRRRDAPRDRRARGDPVRGRDRFTQAAVAVGYRSGRRVAGSKASRRSMNCPASAAIFRTISIFTTRLIRRPTARSTPNCTGCGCCITAPIIC